MFVPRDHIVRGYGHKPVTIPIYPCSLFVNMQMRAITVAAARMLKDSKTTVRISLIVLMQLRDGTPRQVAPPVTVDQSCDGFGCCSAVAD